MSSDHLPGRLPTEPWTSPTDLPPRVWALVLRDATFHTMHCVAHTCRALHAIVASGVACPCSTDSELLASDAAGEHAHSRPFWTHLRDVRPPPSQDDWWVHLREGHVAHMALALRCGADPSAGQLAIRWASGLGYIAIVELLLRDTRVDPGACRQAALYLACGSGHLAVVERLLRDKRVDPGADNQGAIRRASENGHLHVVNRLLEDKRVDPSADGQYAVRRAIINEHYAVVARLLREDRVGRDISALSECLIDMYQYGQKGAILALLERHCEARARRDMSQ